MAQSEEQRRAEKARAILSALPQARAPETAPRTPEAAQRNLADMRPEIRQKVDQAMAAQQVVGHVWSMFQAAIG